MKIRFHINTVKPEATEKFKVLAEKACTFGFQVVDKGEADIVIVIGGDGTILRAVHEEVGVPILGINSGGLGYLSSIGWNEVDKALEMLKEGKYTISERKLLEVNGSSRALNDIVITREMTGRSALLDLVADGRLVTTYMADGLIFATPTGSTAYSLSAGGPVLMPDSSSFVVTPLNPHALAVRPLVIKDSAEFKVTVRSRTAGNALCVGVYADGEHVLTLGEGESIEICRSERKAHLVELAGYDPYDVLARKLGWSGSNIC